MATPTISVIVPCYSYGQYLKEALQSLADQTVLPDEIIIVSDGAIDNSVEIAKDFKLGNPQLDIRIIEKKNGGLASARNAGVIESRSEYVFSFDSDDILRPDTIKVYKELAEPNTVVTLPLMAFGSENYTARPEIGSLEIFRKRNCIYSNSLFPVKLWRLVGGFDESEVMRLGLEDWLYWGECARAGAKFKTGDYVSLLWRRHPKSMSSSSANPNWEKITKYIYEKLNRPA